MISLQNCFPRYCKFVSTRPKQMISLQNCCSLYRKFLSTRPNHMISLRKCFSHYRKFLSLQDSTRWFVYEDVFHVTINFYLQDPTRWFLYENVLHITVNFSPQDLARWFCYKSETNEQPIRFNFDVKVCWPVSPYNQIFCPHHFNLRSLYFQSLQSFLYWIQLHTLETSALCSPCHWRNNKSRLPSITVFY